jgi:hypothetical protein
MAFDTPNRTSHSTRLFALDIAQGRQALDNADEALRVGMARSGEHLRVLSIRLLEGWALAIEKLFKSSQMN